MNKVEKSAIAEVTAVSRCRLTAAIRQTLHRNTHTPAAHSTLMVAKSWLLRVASRRSVAAQHTLVRVTHTRD